MKVVFRISILLNILFAVYILIKGGMLFLEHYMVPETEVAGEAQAVTETASSMERITCDTLYSVSEYDISTGREEVYQELLPSSFVGMNRVSLMEWIDEYNLSASLEDLENGFISMELLSFSSAEVRVRKRIETKHIEPEEERLYYGIDTEESSVSGNEIFYGCILVHDGLLTVYDGQRRHVVLYTDIPLFDLSPEVQQEILEGKYVYSEEELYSLLESYSS